MKLTDQHCIHGAAALDPATVQARLLDVPEWQAIDGSIAPQKPRSRTIRRRSVAVGSASEACMWGRRA